MRDAQQLIDALHRRNPGAVELAKVASPAVQVEPQLLRMLRLRLLPDVDASAEADLWLSDLVDSKSPLAMVLAGPVQRRLQQLLAADPEIRDAATAIVAEAHSGIDAAMRAQEEVTALALKGEMEIEEVPFILGPIIKRLERAPHPGLARWAIRAFHHFPPAAQATDAAKRLFVAGFGGGGPGDTEFPRIHVGVRMLPTTVEIFATDRPDPRLRIIDVPDTDAVVFLDLAWSESEPAEAVSFPVGETLRRPRQSDELILTTLLGDRYIISVNVAASDRALVIGIGSEEVVAAQEMAEWLTSPEGGRIPREQVDVRVVWDRTTGAALDEATRELTSGKNVRRRAVIYFAGVLVQEGDDLLMMPADKEWQPAARPLSVSEILNRVRRRFREVVIIADGRSAPLDVAFEKLPIAGRITRPLAIMTATAVDEAGVGEFSRTLLRVFRRAASRGAHLSMRALRDATTDEIQASNPELAVRVKLFSVGEIHLVEPRSGLFEIRLLLPPEWSDKPLRLVDTDDIEHELRPVARLMAGRVPPGLYFVEISDLSYSKPVTAGLIGRKTVAVQWEPRDAWAVVAGTGAFHLTPAENEMVRAMARKLAGAGFRLVVGGGEGVDFLAAEIYTQTLQRFGRSNADFLRQYSIRHPYYGGGPHVPEQRPVDMIRAAIIIGGHDGTRSYVRRADQAGVPIIPIGGTGSAAEETWSSFAARDKLPEWLTTKIVDGRTADAMAEKVIRYLEIVLLRSQRAVESVPSSL